MIQVQGESPLERGPMCREYEKATIPETPGHDQVTVWSEPPLLESNVECRMSNVPGSRSSHFLHQDPFDRPTTKVVWSCQEIPIQMTECRIVLPLCPARAESSDIRSIQSVRRTPKYAR